MRLYPVCWTGSKEESFDAVKPFIDHITKLYPEVLIGGVVQVSVDSEPSQKLLKWAETIDSKLEPCQGIGVAVINLEGELINQLYGAEKTTIQKPFSFVEGFNNGNKLIVINEGVLLFDNPSQEIIDLRKIKVGMHELLEVHYPGIDLHHKKYHPGPATCVNDYGIIRELIPYLANKGLLTIKLNDYRADFYCKNCDELFRKI